ncbi:MAG: hypothetical protein GIX03_14435 [Candidatus Eremiobacteraeota bacterium]|nr:hypothetical protein [Candidatus Eremiobacteraeota bacterium]MBC5804808.1 hypothetical protein [Candidatus Eremiobacteraeota bacterium]MBC5824592.1 hypothetical protein [Candidatus Eremiobacteraeota bacterium]
MHHTSWSRSTIIPIGSYNPQYGVMLSSPSILGRTGVVRVLEPDLDEEKRQALERSAQKLREALARAQRAVAVVG